MPACPLPGQQDLREFSWNYLHAACNQQSLTLVGHEGDVFLGRLVARWYRASLQPVRITRSARGMRPLENHEMFCEAILRKSHASLFLAGDLLRLAAKTTRSGCGIGARASKYRVIDALESHVLAVAFSPDGQLLAGGGRQPRVRLEYHRWLPCQGTCRQRMHHPRIQFLPDGSRLIAGTMKAGFTYWSTSDWGPGDHTYSDSRDLLLAGGITCAASCRGGASWKIEISARSAVSSI